MNMIAVKTNNHRLNLNNFDCVLMLTWSNWESEMPSNRFHFASRLAKKIPVLFVQPDLKQPSIRAVSTKIPNLYVIKIFQNYGPIQNELLHRFLDSRRFDCPLLWIYNTNFVNFLVSKPFPCTLYHATEDYLCDDFLTGKGTEKIKTDLLKILENIDLAIAVSKGVMESLRTKGHFKKPVLLSTNGCDCKFWNTGRKLIPSITRNGDTKIALYQGGISRKIDFDLLDFLTNQQDWKFWFCGNEISDSSTWKKIRQKPNVLFFGCRLPLEIKKMSSKATIGIVPFVKNDWIVNRSFPLKVFEYLGAGLPVITTPINALEPYEGSIIFADSYEKFQREMNLAVSRKNNRNEMSNRTQLALNQDYARKFNKLVA